MAQSTLSPKLGFLPHVSSLAAWLTAAAAVFRRGGATRWCCEQGRRRLNCGGVAAAVADAFAGRRTRSGGVRIGCCCGAEARR